MTGYVSKKAMANERSYMDVVDDAIDLTMEYMDDCAFTKVDQLTYMDKTYLASLLQLGIAEYEQIITEHM
jgi:hypothetical protein